MLGRKTIGTISYLAGVPAFYREFTWSLLQLVQYNAEFLISNTQLIHYDKVDFSDHGPARNTLVNRFLGDWLLTLDVDHSFDPDILGRILYKAQKYNVDVITGLYQLKTEPYCPVLFAWTKSKKGKDVLTPIVSWDKSTDLIQIGSAGAGCLWVRRKVFDRIRKELKEEPFDRLKGYSEDHSFFIRLHKLGIKAYCDHHIKFNHLKVNPVDDDDFVLDPKLKLQSLEAEGFKQETYIG